MVPSCCPCPLGRRVGTSRPPSTVPKRETELQEGQAFPEGLNGQAGLGFGAVSRRPGCRSVPGRSLRDRPLCEKPPDLDLLPLQAGGVSSAVGALWVVVCSVELGCTMQSWGALSRAGEHSVELGHNVRSWGAL